MRKILAVLLVLAFVAPVVAETERQGVDVSWELKGCWISLGAPSSHTIAPSDGTEYDNWQVGQIIGNNQAHRVEVRTSCRGYSLSVKSTDFDLPTGHGDSGALWKAITDFELNPDVVTGGVNSEWSGWNNFTTFGNDKTILQIDNPKTTKTDMYYQYHIDKNDVSGNYTMHLTYTASTE